MACTNVATKSPTRELAWLVPQEVCWTMRGENCPIANWTTTMVIVRTSAARRHHRAAIVVRIAVADVGPPVNHLGIAS